MNTKPFNANGLDAILAYQTTMDLERQLAEARHDRDACLVVIESLSAELTKVKRELAELARRKGYDVDESVR